MRLLSSRRWCVHSVCLLALLSQTAGAVTVEWQQPGGGDLAIDGNWLGGSAPTPSDDALFALSGANNYLANTNLNYNSATFRDGINSLAMNTNTLTLSDGLIVGDTATPVSLLLSSGNVDSAATSTSSIGLTAGSDGTLTIDNATFTATDFFRIGDFGSGRLNVQNGGIVQTLDPSISGMLGQQVGSTGIVTIDGGGSVWNASGPVVVGFDGNGNLDITGGGVLNSANGSIGSGATSNSAVLISGTGSQWNNTAAGGANLGVGSSGVGSLTIELGGLFMNDGTDIARFDGSMGTVIVDGTNSSFVDTDDLLVGEGGSGNMTVRNDASASVGNLLIIGEEGTSTGELNIESGGEITVGSSTILGDELGSEGTLNVNGSGSLLDGTGSVVVGFDGDGTLNVTNGGSVTSDSRLVVGLSAPGSGTAIVDGAGSSITVQNDVELGTNGPAILEILNGGMVSSATGEFDTAAEVTVDGTDSLFDITGDITNLAGFGFADAVIEVTDGGTMTNANSNWGTNTTITVDGVGSEWHNSGHMQFDAGTLTVSGGGLVTAVNATFEDTLVGLPTTVTGANSQIEITGFTAIANDGIALLQVEAGGTLLTDSVNFADGGTATGSLTVTGTNSNWTDTGDVILGFDGSGSLIVQDSGTANLTNVSVAAFGGSNGLIFLDGAGSTLTADDMTIGGSGRVAGGTATMEVGTGAAATIGNLLVLTPGTLTMSGGTVVATNFDASAGTLNHEDGLIEIDGGTLTSNPTLVVGNNSPGTGSPILRLSNGASTTPLTSIVVADAGDGVLEIVGGTTVIGNLPVTIGNLAGSSGTLLVEGTGSSLDIGTGTLTVGKDGAGTLNVRDGGSVDADTISIGSGAPVPSHMEIDGPGSSLTAGAVFVGNSSEGELSVGNGASVVINSLLVGMSGPGTAIIDGANTSLQTDILRLGFQDDSDMDVTGGALVLTNNLIMADTPGSSSSLSIVGTNSQLTTDTALLGSNGFKTIEVLDGGRLSISFNTSLDTGTMLIEGDGAIVETGGMVTVNSFTITVGPGGTMDVGGTLYLPDQGGVVNLNGGTINMGALVIDPSSPPDQGTFNFLAGMLGLDGDFEVGTNGIFGPNFILGAQQTMMVAGTTTIDPANTLTIDGGHFSTNSLVNNGAIDFASGKFSLTGDDLTIGLGGLLGGSLLLNAQQEVHIANNATVDSGAQLRIDGGSFSASQTINNGRVILGGQLSTLGGTLVTNGHVLEGSGTVTARIDNLSAGSVRALTGNHLVFAGGSNTNSGDIDLLGGIVEFTQDLTNQSTGVIAGGGTLIVGSLVNEGTLQLGTDSNLLGEIQNQAGGTIVISGAATTLVFDDVVHNGAEIRVGAGSTAVFFGNVTGGGLFTGTGTTFFEGSLSPGNSPGQVMIEGDAEFGSSSTLSVELAGLTPGTEFDQLSVLGSVTLDGNLEVELLAGFTAEQGDTFEVVQAAAGLTGEFSLTSSPALPGALQLVPVYTGTSVLLAVVPALTGDYNADGTVNLADYTVWRDSLGATGVGLAADGDLSGTVDADDYLEWKNNFGAVAPAAASNAIIAPVPEPSAEWLLLVVGLGIAGGRHFRSLPS